MKCEFRAFDMMSRCGRTWIVQYPCCAVAPQFEGRRRIGTSGFERAAAEITANNGATRPVQILRLSSRAE